MVRALRRKKLASAVMCTLGLSASFVSPAYVAASNWTGEIDGNFSTTQNWLGGSYYHLNFSGDNLLGNAVTTVNNDLTGNVYRSIKFNENSTLTSNFSLTGSVLELVSYQSSGQFVKPVISSYAGVNSIANDIQAHELTVDALANSSLSLNNVLSDTRLNLSAADAGSLTVNNIQANALQVSSSSAASVSLNTVQADTSSFYASGAGSSLILNDTITLTGGQYGSEDNFTETIRTPNLRLSALNDASLVVNGDIIDSPTSPGGVGRYVSINGAGVEFNGNMDIYAGGALASQLAIRGSTINGSMAASTVWADSAIINGQIQTRNLQTEGETSLTGTVELVDWNTTSVKVVDGGNLTLSGAGEIISASTDPASSQTVYVMGATLTLDNAGQASSSRIADNVAVYLGSDATFDINSNAITAVNEQIGALEVGVRYNQSNFEIADVYDHYSGGNYNIAAHGEATVQLDANTSLTATEITTAPGRWLNVVPTSGTLGGGAAADPALMLLSAPGLNNGLLDGVLINNQEFATYDATNGVVSATSVDNVRFDTVTSLPVTGSPQIMNSLALNFDGQLGGSDELQLSSGQLLANGSVTIAPSVNFGSQQGRLYAFGDVDFAGGMTANNGLQVSGDQDFESAYLGTTLNMRTVGFSGGAALSGPLGIDSATVQLATGQSANINGGALNNAVLNNAGTVSIDGHLEVLGENRINNSGTLTNNGGNIGSVPGVSTVGGRAYIENTGTLTNQSMGTLGLATLLNEGGDFTNDNATFRGSISNSNGGMVTNRNGAEISAYLKNNNATVINEAGSSWTSYGGFNNVNGGNVVNSGYMEGNAQWYGGPDPYAADFYVDAASSLQNNGEIKLNGGNIHLKSGAQYSGGGIVRLTEECGLYSCVGGRFIAEDPNFYFTGTLYGEAGFTRNGGTIHGDASLSVNGGTVYGHVTAAGGALQNNGTINGQVSGSTITNNGTLSLDKAGSSIGTLINNDTASFSAAVSISSLVNKGTFNNSHNLALSSVTNKGTFNNYVSETFNTLTNTDVATLNNHSNLSIATLRNRSTGTIVNKAGATISVSGGVNEGSITNEANANLSIAGFRNADTLNNIDGTVEVTSWFNNTGSITNTGTINNSGSIANSGTINNSSSIINTGSMNVAETGSISGTGTYIQDAGRTIVNGSLEAASVTINGGSLSGSGTIHSSVVVADGSVGPGNSPGILEVTGDFVLSEMGTLHMEVGSDGLDPAGYLYDQLIVGGAYDLQGGLLKFSLLDGITINDFETDFLITDFFRSGTAGSNVGFDLLQLSMFDNLDLYAFDVLGDSWFTLTLDESGGFVSAASVSPVPVPAAVWLFGSGLLGLIGVARKKAA